MRLRSLLLAAALLLPSLPAVALPPNWQPMANGYQQVTPTVSTALTVPAGGTVEAFIICHGQAVRWRDDGVAPTASVGVYLPADTPFPYIANLPSFRFIQTTATATCDVSYYK